jgi:hypothetical protein
MHLDLLKAKSTDEACQLSAPARWLESHIATDRRYVVEVLSDLEKIRQLAQ